ncbi:MAG: HAD family hydrolase [Acidobacteria bacterium]|nr:HAD family hydrolase [Acidobacteriota bacterium]
MKYVVFDFDGPIFDGRRAAIAALEKTISNFESSYRRPNLSLKALALHGPTRLISLLYSELELTDRKSIHDFYREQLLKEERELNISETVRAALESLRRAGFSLAIYSARLTEELVPLLREKGIAQCFASVGCRPEFTKPSGEYFRKLAETSGTPLSEILYIGDSDWDYDAAQDGNVQYYHAGWTDEPNTIALKKPDLILSSLDELVNLLEFDRSQTRYSGDLPDEALNAVRNKQFSFYGGAGISVPSGIGTLQAGVDGALRGLSGQRFRVARGHTVAGRESQSVNARL